MLEALVLFLCVGDFECSQALKAYRSQSSYVKDVEHRVKKWAKQEIGPELGIVITTAYVTAMNRDVRVRLGGGFVLSAKRDEIGVRYRYDF